MSKVLYISTDGMRPDALAEAHTPNFHELMRRGSYSLSAQSVMPSVSLPCHMTIFHSVPPERHGVTTNDWTPMVKPIPGLIEVLDRAGKRCASYFSWEPLCDLSRPNSLARSIFIRYERDPEVSDRRIVDAALPQLKTGDYDFSFLYLGAIDEVGHDYGWMSKRYLEQVEHSDLLVGDILEVLPGDTFVLIHSDHGGHDRGHGSNQPEDMSIPWLVSGPSIKENYPIPEAISLLDSAPTIAHILGLKAPEAWEGKVIHSVFKTQQK